MSWVATGKEFLLTGFNAILEVTLNLMNNLFFLSIFVITLWVPVWRHGIPSYVVSFGWSLIFASLMDVLVNNWRSLFVCLFCCCFQFWVNHSYTCISMLKSDRKSQGITVVPVGKSFFNFIHLKWGISYEVMHRFPQARRLNAEV